MPTLTNGKLYKCSQKTKSRSKSLSVNLDWPSFKKIKNLQTFKIYQYLSCLIFTFKELHNIQIMFMGLIKLTQDSATLQPRNKPALCFSPLKFWYDFFTLPCAKCMDTSNYILLLTCMYETFPGYKIYSNALIGLNLINSILSDIHHSFRSKQSCGH